VKSRRAEQASPHRSWHDGAGLQKGSTLMNWHQLLNPSKKVGRMSLLAGFIAGEACSLYAIFIAHTMDPVSFRLVENTPQLRAIYGRYQEIYNFDGLTLTLVASLVVFAMVCCAVRGITWPTASDLGFNRWATRQVTAVFTGVAGLEPAPLTSRTVTHVTQLNS
jgi:hypothetical protein